MAFQINLLNKLRGKISHDFPAFDELVLFALKRCYLGVNNIENLDIKDNSANDSDLSNNIRLFKIDEISFDSNEKIHLPGVESSITAMRNRGYSLIFIVQGNCTGVSVYMGVSIFPLKEELNIQDVLDSYMAVWESNFPGSKFEAVDAKEIKSISHQISQYENIGVLTGIPSLKREEQSGIFVQGLERLIRAMRGKTYTWLSIADPIHQSAINQAINRCQQLQSDIHHLVKAELSHAKSTGKTVMLGIMGMMGKAITSGETSGTNSTEMEGTSSSHTKSTGIAQSLGGSINFVPNVAGSGGVGGEISYQFTHSKSWSDTVGIMKSFAKGVCNSISKSISNQLGGGSVGTFGLTFTETSSVGVESLNRKAEYTEELLKKYEERLQNGAVLGMWNIGHYFCAQNPADYNLGIGVVSSLCAGMENSYEPPNAINLDPGIAKIISRFQNIVLRFQENPPKEDVKFADHPLGVIFNGPSTPVTTPELAIVTPFALQDVEGVTVSKRISFGLNVQKSGNQQKTLSIGNVLDKGNETKQMYRLALRCLPKHLSIFGMTGSGKTNTVHQLLIQLWRDYRVPFMVIEPAKAEYRALASSPELQNDLLIISAGIDRTDVCPLRLSPFYFNPGRDSDANRVHLLTHIDRLKAVFNASFPMYGPMPYILEEAIHKIYTDRGWDLGQSCNRYVDIYKEDFNKYIPTLDDLKDVIDTVVHSKGYYIEQEMNIRAALKARLSSLVIGAKGSMFNAVNSIPADDLFSKPVVVELEHLGDDDEKAFLMGLLVSKLYEYRKTTFANIKEQELPFKHILVIEEAHRLLANIPDTSANMESANVKGKAVSAFVDMLSEIRALGQSVFIVDQLPSRVSPNIVKGTGTKIVHRLLAKDDRESVGWTMGLNEDQINDLCLLRTGECVVNQDGDRKSFMCKVNKNDLHENRTGDEVSAATSLYKKTHAGLFAVHSNYIDMENTLFQKDLHKAMLAIGIGQTPDKLLRKFSVEAEKTQFYWQKICREIWSYYGGNFQIYLEFCRVGADFLRDSKSIEPYRALFKQYFEQTSAYEQSTVKALAGIAYDQLFLRNETLVTLNKRYDMIKECEDSVQRLGIAMRNLLPTLLHKEADRCVYEQVISAILAQIAPHITATQILENF